MKSLIFNGLLMPVAVGLAHLAIRELPDLRELAPATLGVTYREVALPVANGPLRPAGAWEMQVNDRRFGGLSALTIDGGRFLAISDRGAVMRFDPPSVREPQAWLADLRSGPGAWGEKWARDAESVTRDPQGRGWWVGYEQRHSLWLYDASFGRALTSVDLGRSNWPDNRGAEGLLGREGQLLVLAENGRDAVRIGPRGPGVLRLYSNADVADATVAPDGSAWVLLRTKGLSGIEQAIAPLHKTHDGYRTGTPWPLPKGAFDNYEGMAIEARPDGRWRFWLVTDDGHRIMARTLLVALDLDPPIRHDRSSATGAGLSETLETKKR